jgi:multiple antibiotic resistance protein
MSIEEMVVHMLIIFSQLFAIMNPLSALPIYLSEVEEYTSEERKYIARRITIVTGVLLIVFTLAGDWLLTFFGISIPALRLGGGVLLMAISIDMLGGLPKTKSVDIEEAAIVPLATPLLVGPGTITTILLLETVYSTWEILIVDIILTVTTFIILYYGEQLFKFLGKSFIATLGRVMAVIVAAIAAQMIHDAIIEWFPNLVS